MIGPSIHNFCDVTGSKDLKGKTSIELQDKPVNFPSVKQPQMFRSLLKRIKQRYVNKIQVLAICYPF